jgi:hypothetical protein
MGTICFGLLVLVFYEVGEMELKGMCILSSAVHDPTCATESLPSSWFSTGITLATWGGTFWLTMNVLHAVEGLNQY